MITALSKRPREYTLVSDRDSEVPTVFTLKNMDRFETAEIQERFPVLEQDTDKPGAKKVNVSEMLDAYLEVGLLGWKNLSDDDGQPVEFSKENFKLLPFVVANELVNKITGSITEEDRKNSEG